MGRLPGLKSKKRQAQALAARMSLEEKASFCSGRSFWRLESCERLGVPSVMMTDGPHGLRKQSGSADHAGLGGSMPAVCFPTASALACSWNLKLAEEVGVALGEQCAAENVTLLPIKPPSTRWLDEPRPSPPCCSRMTARCCP